LRVEQNLEIRVVATQRLRITRRVHSEILPFIPFAGLIHHIDILVPLDVVCALIELRVIVKKQWILLRKCPQLVVYGPEIWGRLLDHRFAVCGIDGPLLNAMVTGVPDPEIRPVVDENGIRVPQLSGAIAGTESSGNNGTTHADVGNRVPHDSVVVRICDIEKTFGCDE
jgi:hypothetical protein